MMMLLILATVPISTVLQGANILSVLAEVVREPPAGFGNALTFS